MYYVRRWHVTDEYIGLGAGARISQVGHYICRLTDEYIGAGARAGARVWQVGSYIRWLTMNIRVLFFYYCLFWLSIWTGASKRGRIYRNNHTQHQIYNIVYDTWKKNKFDNSRQYSSRQAKVKLKLWQAKAKLKLQKEYGLLASLWGWKSFVDKPRRIPLGSLANSGLKWSMASQASLLAVKGRRRRSEGGEWEPIKISHRNLAYVPKSTRCPSLLTRPRPPIYGRAINPQNRVSNCSRHMKQC
jgi:hypothetical protein